jgi:hypothetical protein
VVFGPSAVPTRGRTLLHNNYDVDCFTIHNFQI